MKNFTPNKQKENRNSLKKFKKSAQGFLTVQFMIAFIFIMFFIISFLGLALTLVHASLTQYLTYSSARKNALGGESIGAQKDAGEQRYQDIREGLFKGSHLGGSDWFVIPTEATIGENTQYSEKSRPVAGLHLFYGSHLTFKSNVINFQIPSLTDSSDETNRNLETTVGSYLGREPSREECEGFLTGSELPIGNDPDKYPAKIGGQELSPTKFFSDNGC